MSKTIVTSLLPVLVAAFTLNLNADMAWTASDVMPDDWSEASSNLLALQVGTISGQIATGYSTNDGTLLTDGSVPTVGGKDWIVGFQNNASVEWMFNEPMTLENIRVSACYLEGPAYTRLAVSAVYVKLVGSDVWDSLVGSSFSDIGGRNQGVILCASLSDPAVGYISRRVVGLKIVFGNNGALASYCAEIEASGHPSLDDPVPPAFNAPEVDVRSATRAAVSASVSDLGGRATRASIYFAYGTNPSALGASECLVESASVGMSYSKTLTGLTPETTYYYAFFATNNVTDSGSIVTGSFTMPSATMVNCQLDIPVGVSVKVGGLTYTESVVLQMPKGDEVVFMAVPANQWHSLLKRRVRLRRSSHRICSLRPSSGTAAMATGPILPIGTPAACRPLETRLSLLQERVRPPTGGMWVPLRFLALAGCASGWMQKTVSTKSVAT